MVEKDARLSIRLTAEAKRNLDTYCRFTGQKPAEVVRAGIASMMAPYFSQIIIAPPVPEVAQEPIEMTENRLESDDERTGFTKAFIGAVDSKKFPPRIARAIKENWEDIKAFGVNAEELANIYNEYCRKEGSAGREFCHPNSWISNHGWLNEDYQGTGGPIYDTDR